MASSESENSFLEQLINSRNRDLSILFPLILGIMGGGGGAAATTTTDGEEDDDDDDAAQADHHRETTDRIIFINPFTQGMIVLEAGRSLEALLRELAESGNKGPPPASKGSIDEMPRVRVEVAEEECSICLEEMVGEAREMPCKHRYHSNCIEMWLGLHGSCPVCRYRMPLEEEDEGNKAGEGGGRVYAEEEEGGVEEGGGRRRRRRRREIWVTFSVNRRSNSSSSSSSSTTDRSSSSSSSDFDEN